MIFNSIYSQGYIFGNRFRGYIHAFEKQMRQQNFGYIHEPRSSRRRAEIGKFKTRTRRSLSVEFGESLLRVQNVQRSSESQSCADT